MAGGPPPPHRHRTHAFAACFYEHFAPEFGLVSQQRVQSAIWIVLVSFSELLPTPTPLFERRFIHFASTRLLLLIQVLHNDISPALPRGPSIFVFPRSRVAFSFHPSKSQSLRLRRMFMLS